MNSDAGNTPSRVLGSPIRTPSDHSSFGSSPRLIAAYYVLHRLLVPRHPPCALTHLHSQTIKDARVHCAVLKQHTPTPPTPPAHNQQHLGNQCQKETTKPHKQGPMVLFQTPNSVFHPGPRSPETAGPEPTARDHSESYAIVFHPMSHPACHTRTQNQAKTLTTPRQGMVSAP